MRKDREKLGQCSRKDECYDRAQKRARERWVYSFTMNTIKSSQKEARNTPLENEQEILLCSIYCNNSNVLAIAINLLYYFIDAFPHKICIPCAQTNKQCHRHKHRRQ